MFWDILCDILPGESYLLLLTGYTNARVLTVGNNSLTSNTESADSWHYKACFGEVFKYKMHKFIWLFLRACDFEHFLLTWDVLWEFSANLRTLSLFFLLHNCTLNWRKLLLCYMVTCWQSEHAYEIWKQCQWIMKMPTCKQKNLGENLWLLKSHLSAFLVFNVLETWRRRTLMPNLEISDWQVFKNI